MTLAAAILLSLLQLSADPAATEPRGAHGELPTIEELAEALVEPRLTQEIGDLAEYSVGGLTLELDGGQTHAVAVGERVVGFFFAGKGTVSFALDDPLAADLFELNIRRATPYKLTEGVLSVGLEAALVLDNRMVEGASDPGPAPADALRAFERHLERFGKDRLIDPPNQIAQAMLDDAPRVVVARMKTGKDDLLYRFDELSMGTESLYRMQRYASDSGLRQQRFPMHLASRPIGHGRLEAAAPRFVLRHVDLDLVNPREEALDLVVEERIEILEPLRTLEFSLWSEIFHERKRYPYELDRVALVDAANGQLDLAFSHRNGDLVVQLPSPVDAGEEVRLRFELRGDLLHRPSRDSYWWLPIGTWLPTPPRFDMRSYTLDAKVCAAPPFEPFGMGSTKRRYDEGEHSCLEFELTDPVQFSVVLAGKYHSYSETRDGQTITLSSYAFNRDGPMERIADNVFELIDYYEGLLGPFPYPELNILEINSYGFGIGPPGVIYLTQEGFDPGPSGQSFRKEINMRLAHEVAHMWWGHVAQMRSPDEQWLSESTAEYFAALAVDALVGREGFKKARREWLAEAGNSKTAPSIYLANHLAGERAAFDRRNLLYARGPLMLDALRDEIGDDAFFEIMRRLVDENHHQYVHTAQFIELTNEVTGRDLRDWFDRELFGLE